nr:uncharacterized protein LOC109181355 isoform X1 [Ipomoea batatas]
MLRIRDQNHKAKQEMDIIGVCPQFQQPRIVENFLFLNSPLVKLPVASEDKRPDSPPPAAAIRQPPAAPFAPSITASRTASHHRKSQRQPPHSPLPHRKSHRQPPPQVATPATAAAAIRPSTTEVAPPATTASRNASHRQPARSSATSPLFSSSSLISSTSSPAPSSPYLHPQRRLLRLRRRRQHFPSLPPCPPSTRRRRHHAFFSPLSSPTLSLVRGRPGSPTPPCPRRSPAFVIATGIWKGNVVNACLFGNACDGRGILPIPLSMSMEEISSLYTAPSSDEVAISTSETAGPKADGEEWRNRRKLGLTRSATFHPDIRQHSSEDLDSPSERNPKAILEDETMPREIESPSISPPKANQHDSSKKMENPTLRMVLDAFTSSLNNFGNALEGIGMKILRKDVVLSRTKLQTSFKKNANYRSGEMELAPSEQNQGSKTKPHSVSEEKQVTKIKLTESRKMAVATAAKAKLLLRELKTLNQIWPMQKNGVLSWGKKIECFEDWPKETITMMMTWELLVVWFCSGSCTVFWMHSPRYAYKAFGRRPKWVVYRGKCPSNLTGLGFCIEALEWSLRSKDVKSVPGGSTASVFRLILKGSVKFSNVLPTTYYNVPAGPFSIVSSPLLLLLPSVSPHAHRTHKQQAPSSGSGVQVKRKKKCNRWKGLQRWGSIANDPVGKPESACCYVSRTQPHSD